MARQEVLRARPCRLFVTHRVQRLDGEHLTLLNQQATRMVSPQAFERRKSGARVVVSEKCSDSCQAAAGRWHGSRRRWRDRARVPAVAILARL
jgi:hypothetical protein